MRISSALLLVMVALGCAAPRAATASERGKAAMMSLLLPGWGQAHLGDRTMAQVFGAAEVASLAGVVTFSRQITLRRDSQYLFARLHAVADVAPYGAAFERQVGEYLSNSEFNRQEVLYQAEIYYAEELDPARRIQLIQQFVERYSYQGAQSWNWDFNDNRVEYLKLLKARLGSQRNRNFAFGLLVANHLLAAADAFRPRHPADTHVGLWDAVPMLSADPLGGQAKLQWAVHF